MRTLLALLLLRANQVVTVKELTDRLWDASPPANPRAAIQTYVGRLRDALDDRANGQLIQTSPRGYLIQVGAEHLDLIRFRELVAAAVRVSAPGEQVSRLEAALALWRGQPLADLDSGWLANDEVPGLAEERLHAVELLLDARLQLGEHASVIAELTGLTREHPLRERFWGQLMLALYRCGRQGEALETYRTVAKLLAEQLGVDPSADLQRLHQAVLTADPQLTPAARPAVASATAAVPAQLPADVAGFTGRGEHLARLDAGLAPADSTSSAAAVTVISGTAGVGKTALALHWAHHVKDLFPDGQLYVDLQGYGPESPAQAGDVLAGFLRALGMDNADVPQDLGERAARFRTLVAGRRLLIVLDNANAANQIRPLLPGTSSSYVVVTSRDTLSGLIVRDGARRVELDRLTTEEARSLLRALVDDRVDADPPAAEALVALCLGLPLALRLAAELAINRPSAGLAGLAEELADEQRQLDLLGAADDPQSAIRAVFSWSYQSLPEPAARMFRLLGLHTGHDLDAYDFAALAGTDLAGARVLIDDLSRAHLIEESGHGSFGLHELLRSYAAELAAADPTDERRAALVRLFDRYLHTASLAMDVISPSEADTRPTVAPARTPTQSFSFRSEAMRWLDSALPHFLSTVDHAGEHGWFEHATALSETLFGYLHIRGDHEAALAVHSHGLAAARAHGDTAAEARAMHRLGAAYAELGSYAEADRCFEHSLGVARATGDLLLEAQAEHSVGRSRLLAGRYRDAVGHLRRSLELAQSTGNRMVETTVLSALGYAYLQVGSPDEALEPLRRALALTYELATPGLTADVLDGFGVAYLRMERYPEALGYLQRALALAQSNGDRVQERDVLDSLAQTYLRMERHDEAVLLMQRSLALSRSTGSCTLEAVALNGLGEVIRSVGSPLQAIEYHERALELALAVGHRPEQARAHDGVACARRDLGQPDLARLNWELAMELYADISDAEVSRIADRVDELPGAGHQPAARAQ